MADEQFGSRLYHRRDIFILRNESGSIEINEPIGWDKIAISLEFDKVTNGFRFEMVAKDITLEFDDAAGRQSIIDAYEADGVDANMYLGFGSVTPEGVVTLDFEMRLSFDTYAKTFSKVKLSAERNSFQDLLRTRFDVEVNLDRETTIDGLALPALDRVNTWLSPIRIQAKDNMIFNDIFTGEDVVLTPFDPPGDDDPILVSVPPFKRPTTKDLDDPEICTDQVQTQQIEGMQEPTEPDGLLIASVPFTKGQINRKFGLEARVAFYVSWPDNHGQDVHIRLSLYKKSTLDGSDIPVTSLIEGYPEIAVDDMNLGALAGTFPALLTLSTGAQIESNEQLFLKVYLLCTNVGGIVPLPDDISMTYRIPESWYLRVTENTNPAASVTPGYRLFEAVNRQLEIILNKRNILKSDFLGRVDLGYDENGCGSHHVTFNGKMLRGGCKTNSTFTMSVKNNYNGLNALYCMGMSIERDDDGNEFVRLEPLGYFFRNVLIFNFDVISDYLSENAPDYVFNELKFGYEKFPNDGQNQSLNEWLNQISYLTPIRTVKNKLEKLCGFILSTLYIQLTREQSFLVKPAATFETDKDNFLLGIRDDEESQSGETVFGPYEMEFDDELKTITIEKWDVPVVAGDTIVIVGGGLNEGSHVVAAVESLTPPLDQVVIYVTTVGLAAGSSTASIELSEARFIPRLDEDFLVVTGVPFPQTKFNLEHSIKRIFYRWSKFFRSGLTEKAGTESIKYTDSEIDTDFVITGNDYACDPPSASYPANRPFADKADELLVDLDNPIYKSNRITFGAPMTWDLMNDWRKCFEARDLTRNYGYFSWKNPDGVLEKGYLESIKFDPIKNFGKFTFIEKPATA